MSATFVVEKSTYSSKAQSLVEFTMTATLLMFVLLAVSDFGLAFLSWITLRDAAQEGAVYGSVYPPYNGDSLPFIRARVRFAATSPINLENLPNSHISVSIIGTDGESAGDPCPGNAIRVNVTYDYHFISPMIGKIFGNDKGEIPISASVTNTILLAGNNADCSE
jgi:hypothetical protein